MLLMTYLINLVL